jgi:hypothetical protein
MLIMRAFAAVLIAVACFCPRLSHAHPTGVSKMDFTLKGDTLEALVDVNSADLFFALQIPTLTYVPRSEYRPLSDRIAYYFQTRMDVKFDGSGTGMKVLQWRREGGEPADRLDSSDLADTSVVLRVAWPIPPGTKRMELGSKLFAELQVQPLAHFRLYYRDQLIKRRFLGLDNRFSLPILPDSLEAYHAAATRPPDPGGAPGPAPDEEAVVWRFIVLGFTHILPHGLDHILFVLGLFFFSTFLRPLLIQVTAFTIAHSITLGMSIMGVFSLPASIVEPLIALSIVVVAAENIFFRKLKPSRWILVFAFGLIHGLGFAGVLRELGLPEGKFVQVLLSFNVGVELGQLAVIAIAAALTAWMWKKPWYFKRVVVPVSLFIGGVGMYWFIERLL